jgi:hypothetical protein
MKTVLRRIFGPKIEKVAGGWRKLHSEELHNAYSLTNIIRMIKLRRMRWVGHVTHILRGEKCVHKILENLKGSDHLENLGMDGKIILE